MDTNVQLHKVAASALRARFGDEPYEMRISRSAMEGGLASKAVERITVRGRCSLGRTRRVTFVAKQLHGAAVREARIYRELSQKLHTRLAPRVLGEIQHDDGRVDLYLDEVRGISNWPWRDLPAPTSVVRRLAELHMMSRGAPLDIPPWNYEDYLQASAVQTLEQLDRLNVTAELPLFFKRGRRALARLVTHLPAVRAALLSFDDFGSSMLHGDVHPGNVIVCRRRRVVEPLFIDWERARIGSALEDVSSWLHSLGYWEPEARRRHDTFVNRYLHAVGYEHGFNSDLRAGVWIASASNALAGALRYHCVAAEHGSTIEQRARAVHNARDWLRVIVRADATAVG